MHKCMILAASAILISILFHFKCISIQKWNDNDRYDADHTFQFIWIEYLYHSDWKKDLP